MVSRQTGVHVCGTKEINFRTLPNLALTLAVSLVSLVISSRLKSSVRNATKAPRDFKIFSEALWWSVFKSGHSLFLEHFRQEHTALGRLFYLIVMSRAASCQHESDHIYAVLGVAAKTFTQPAISHHITPDYAVPTNALYIQVPKVFLEHAQTLDILSYASGGLETSRRAKLPSWVTDYVCELD